MSFTFKRVKGSIYPPVIDTTSSTTGVYYRKNVEEITDDDGNISYIYDEIKMPNEYRFEIKNENIYAAKLEEIINAENKKERDYYNSLTLTPSDVERALYKAKGIDFEDLKEMLKDNPDIDLKALGIELRANLFYRGNPYIGQVGALLGYSSDDMDYLFEHKELPA